MNAIKKDISMLARGENAGVMFRPKHARTTEKAYERFRSNKLSDAETPEFEQDVRHDFFYKENLRPLPYEGLNQVKRLGRLEIMIAADCHHNCGYCYTHGCNYGGDARVMQPNTAVTYLKELIAGKYDDVGAVLFFGCEPTLQPDTIQAVCGFFEAYVAEGLLKSMPAFTMVASGALLNPRLMETIYRYNINVT